MDGLSGRRVLVTGGAGFLGRHVVARGAAAGVEVHSLGSRPAEVPGATRHHAVDLRDSAGVARLVSDLQPAGIIHLAAAGVQAGGQTLADLLAVNVLGLESLLAAADAVEPKPTVVIAGSGFEYAPQTRPLRETDPIVPVNDYGASKAAAGLVAGRHAGRLPIAWVRLFSLYGDGEAEPRLAPYIIARAAEGAVVELTACEQLRDYTYAGDAAEGLWRILAHKREPGAMLTLNLASGVTVTLGQFVEELAGVLAAAGRPPRLEFGAKPYRPGEPMVYLADVARLRAALGWTPATPLVEGLRRMVDHATCPAPL